MTAFKNYIRKTTLKEVRRVFTLLHKSELARVLKLNDREKTLIKFLYEHGYKIKHVANCMGTTTENINLLYFRTWKKICNRLASAIKAYDRLAGKKKLSTGTLFLTEFDFKKSTIRMFEKHNITRVSELIDLTDMRLKQIGFSNTARLDIKQTLWNNGNLTLKHFGNSYIPY